MKREFYSKLIFLALPITIQNLLMNSLSFIDTLMITKVSEEALAAVGLANQMFFLISLFYFGVSSGAAIFVAQYWGAKQIEKLQRTMGIALSLGLLGAFASAFFSFFFPTLIMNIFTQDPIVVAYGVDYLKIVSISYVMTAIVMIYSAALRSTEDSRTPMYISMISLTVNVILNYALILGNFGFPRLEVKGAAIATLIARFLEMMILLIIIYRRKGAVAAPLRILVSFSFDEVKSYFSTCFPVILNEIFWSLGMVFYKIAYARLGTTVIASVNVSQSIEHLFFVVLIGVSNAAAILLGNKIGENKIDLAQKYAYSLIKLVIIIGFIMGLALFFLAPYIPLIFSLSEYVFTITVKSLQMMALLIPMKACTMLIVVGILRSGGDTKFSMMTELAGVWGIGVPLAFIGVLVFKLPIYYIYLLVGLEEFFKGFIGFNRVRSKKWITRLIQEDSQIT
ncbi:MAG: MATE family efflux transporter [Spirochaetia bacterium]|nr:MATE family efflux transporter [Spirochaetia bacterium]